VTAAYAYAGTYVAAPVLANGAGYWLKFGVAESLALIGSTFPRDTIDVTQGWNLIGSISTPVAVGAIGSVPGGMVASQFYDYDGGYVKADSIRPGRGYWVKVGGNGRLVLASSSMTPVAGRIRIVPSEEAPPPPPAGVDDIFVQSLPTEYLLAQNYPNPFNPTTMVSFELPMPSVVTLGVYNTLGQEVARLVDGRRMEEGRYSTEFDASAQPSGVYFYRITATAVDDESNPPFTRAGKMLLMR
jgi:hypothetical protein